MHHTPASPSDNRSDKIMNIQYPSKQESSQMPSKETLTKETRHTDQRQGDIHPSIHKIPYLEKIKCQCKLPPLFTKLTSWMISVLRLNCDENEISILVILDLSAVVDTAEHLYKFHDNIKTFKSEP